MGCICLSPILSVDKAPRMLCTYGDQSRPTSLDPITRVQGLRCPGMEALVLEAGPMLMSTRLAGLALPHPAVPHLVSGSRRRGDHVSAG